jgi:RNA polymerase sigma-70 factor (ECF subfamily)
LIITVIQWIISVMFFFVWPGPTRLLLALGIPTLQETLQLDEAGLVEALRRGDEAVFAAVMDWYSGSLLRLAMAYVPSRAVAEEVVQETWMGVLEGIGRFEGRSSFKTWLFRILTNRAKTRGTRERRYEPFGLPGTDSEGEEGLSLEDRLFVTQGSGKGHWIVPPQGWEPDTPERAFLSKECQKAIEQAIDGLPGIQRQVITLRDVEGLSAEEVCNMLTISETNQRVLLHRARIKVRRVLDPYVRGGNT